MIKLGIIGYPLKHSLSPPMHKAALQELGLEGDYIVEETPPEQLEEKIQYLKNANFRGINVTIPHKVEVMKYLDHIDDFATKVCAVNTIIIDENKKLSGYNTDVYGFMQAIPEEIRKNLSGKNAVILGSGGAARAIAVGLIKIGVQNLYISARNKEKAQNLINILVKNFPEQNIQYVQLSENLDLSGISTVINTTPLGMYGDNEGISPLKESSLETLEDEAFVYDIIYRPRKTKLIEIAEKKGYKTLDGLDMLVLQGALGLNLWTEKQPPVNVMKEALLQTLK